MSIHAIVVKWCKMGPGLLLIIDGKSHICFQMTWKSSILDDLKGHWQPVRSAVLATAELLVLFASVTGMVRVYGPVCNF